MCRHAHCAPADGVGQRTQQGDGRAQREVLRGLQGRCSPVRIQGLSEKSGIERIMLCSHDGPIACEAVDSCRREIIEQDDEVRRRSLLRGGRSAGSGGRREF